MPDFLIPAITAQTSQGPAGPATTTTTARSSNTPSASEGDPAPGESFANVLRKQLEQRHNADSSSAPATGAATGNEAAAGKPGTIAATVPAATPVATDPVIAAATDPVIAATPDPLDPLIVATTNPVIAAATDPLIAAATDTPDAAAILPLLAQLMAQPANPGAKAIGDPAAAGKDPADGSPSPIAGLLAKFGSEEPLSNGTLPKTVTSEPVLDMPRPAIELPANTGLVAKAAISAEMEAPVENIAGLNNKPDSAFAALLNQVGNEQASAHTATRPATTAEVASSLRMERPAGHPAWNNELANKLTWMATSQRQQADLVLNPPHLGRVEISLTVAGDQASAVFASPNAAVREMLENSLPRLREILAGAGINLGEAQVGTESPGQSSQERGENRGSASFRTQALAATQALDSPAQGAHWQQGGRGMVDVFA